MGCPADLDLADEVSRWQHRAWTARMAASGLLGGQYRHLCRHRELAEYMHILTPARVGIHPTQGAVVEAKMRRRAGIVYTASRSKALTPI
jgi:hypothetical protein